MKNISCVLVLIVAAYSGLLTQAADQQVGMDNRTLSNSIEIDAYDDSICGWAVFRPWQDQQRAWNGCYESFQDEPTGEGELPPLAIDGGQEAEPNEFPAHVQLQIFMEGGRYTLCGGTLIHKDLIITAAHCLSLYYKTLRVQAWLGTQENWGYGGKLGKASQWCWPKVFSTHRQHDVAIIKLDMPVEYDVKNIRPACMFRARQHKSGAICAMAGMGMIDEATREVPDYLKTLVVRRNCVATTDNATSCYMAATGGRQYFLNADSGGGVYCYDWCHWYQTERAFVVAAISNNQVGSLEQMDVADFYLNDEYIQTMLNVLINNVTDSSIKRGFASSELTVVRSIE